MSLNNRERLDTLSEIIVAHNKAGNQEFEHAFRLEQERAKTFAAIIQEEGLLAGPWSFCGDKSSWVTLEADEMWEQFPGLRELLEPSYHESYSLWEDDFSQTLRFDDGTLTLRLSHEVAVQFVTDHGIAVGLDRLIDRRDDLAEKLNVANKLLAEMRVISEPQVRRHRERAIRPPREFGE